jgi:hypothetical protein
MTNHGHSSWPLWLGSVLAEAQPEWYGLPFDFVAGGFCYGASLIVLPKRAQSLG